MWVFNNQLQKPYSNVISQAGDRSEFWMALLASRIISLALNLIQLLFLSTQQAVLFLFHLFLGYSQLFWPLCLPTDSYFFILFLCWECYDFIFAHAKMPSVKISCSSSKMLVLQFNCTKIISAAYTLAIN